MPVPGVLLTVSHLAGRRFDSHLGTVRRGWRELIGDTEWL